MRTRIQFILSGILLLGLLSCSKDNDDPATTSKIEGLWIGTYTVDQTPSAGQQYASYAIKPDGAIISDSKNMGVQNICIGTWTLTGTALFSSYHVIYGDSQNIDITQTIIATWDKSGKLTGTWENNDTGHYTGTFTMTRVN
jgi:hypothetical protein